ncbi:DUF4302 domain-containing protein [Mariniflexile sp.]|uniref:DUF4302 domain-containing protein n=1 Tax=Mariniflexile sp. TaxID=1979402 RepID=UPI0035638544
MKNIRNTSYWLISLMFITLFSCNNDDDNLLFSESPAERISQSTSELVNLLVEQQNGYKGVYFTKNDEFGGFTFYMKFNADGTVTMTSDFDSETDLFTSSYDVRLGTATELVFTTRNHIQKVSDPEYGGLRGAGFKGTSVFQFFKNENGTLTFKDVRNSSTASFILEPTGFSDFETESVAKAKESLAQRDNLLPTAQTSVFQVLRFENENGIQNYNLNYDSLRLYATPRTQNDTGEVSELNFGVAFSDTGLTINPAITFEGETYEDFVFDYPTNSYVSTVNGTTATILFSNTPVFLTDDVNGLGKTGHQVFGSRLSFGVNSLTSPGFDALISTVNQNIKGISANANAYWSYSGIEFYVVPNATTGYVTLYVMVYSSGPTSTATYYAGYNFRQTIENNKVYYTYVGAANGNGSYFLNAVTPLLQFFLSPDGMYFTDQGSFSSSLFSYSNLSSTFTSASQPNLRLYGLWFN